jgi:hypothetical protein
MNELLFQPLRYVVLAALFLFLYRVVRALDEDLGRAHRGDGERVVAALVVEEAPPGLDPGQLFLVRSGAVVGRSTLSTVVVPDPQAAEQHLRLVVRGTGFWLEDLGSGAESFLNGRRLEAPAPLADGDRIRVGATVLRFVSPAGGEPPS